MCGTLLYGQEGQLLCDVCKHIRINKWPKGAVGRKVELDKFKSRGCDKDTNKNNCKNATKNSWCHLCMQFIGPSIDHPCTPVAKKF